MMKTTTLDFSDPLIQADPYPHFAALRQDAPVCGNGRTVAQGDIQIVII